jgi:hypothetical protein
VLGCRWLTRDLFKDRARSGQRVTSVYVIERRQAAELRTNTGASIRAGRGAGLRAAGVAGVAPPVRVLAGFARVWLAPGRSKTVTLGKQVFRYRDVDAFESAGERTARGDGFALRHRRSRAGVDQRGIAP